MRKVPTNYILLGAFTVFESLFVCFFVAQFTPGSVLMASFLTMILFGCLFVCGLYVDIHAKWWAPLILSCFVISFFGIFMMLFMATPFLHLVLCWVFLMITCVYTIYDVGIISSKHGLDYDDYIVGAMLLYVDMITLFIYILSIIGNRD